MSNGNVLSQLREMADKKTIATDQAMPLLMAAMADIYQNSEEAKEERIQLRKEIIILAGSVAENKNDIDDLKKRSNIWDGVNSFLVILGTAIMSILNKHT